MTKMRNILLSLSIITFCLTGCKTGPKISSETAADIAAITDSAARISPSYAKGFTVKYLEDGIRLVDIQDPQADKEDKMHVGYQYALMPKGLRSSIF